MAALTGFVENEISWDEIRELIATNQLGKLGRSKPILAEYAKQSAKIKQEYCSIKDYVQIKFLDFPFTEVDVEVPSENTNNNDNNDNKKDKTTIIKKRQAIPTTPPPVSAALYPNDFPYYFPSNVDHLILWCTKTLTKEELDEILPIKLKERYGETKRDVQIFINTVALQSIRDVFHVHVLVQRL